MKNPFQYGSLVSADAFCNRSEEVREIQRSIENKMKLFVYSERRVGKTSLVLHAIKQLPKDNVVIFADLWPTNDEDSFVKCYARALTKAFSPSPEKALAMAKSLFSTLRPSVTLDESGSPRFEFGTASAKEKSASLDEVLQAPEKIRTKTQKNVTVIFDEFQQILEYGTDTVERQIRSVIQHQDDISYLFLGSRKHLIQRMVLDSSRPLYRAGSHMPLRNIAAEHWVPFIQKKFLDSGKFIDGLAIESLLEQTQGHPFYTQHLCHALWEIHGTNDSGLNTEPGVKVMLDQVRALELVLDREDSAYSAIWTSLSVNQKKFLEVLANEEAPVLEIFSSEFIQKTGLKSASSVQRVVDSLIKRDTIDQESGVTFITDRFFRLWIKRKIG